MLEGQYFPADLENYPWGKKKVRGYFHTHTCLVNLPAGDEACSCGACTKEVCVLLSRAEVRWSRVARLSATGVCSAITTCNHTRAYRVSNGSAQGQHRASTGSAQGQHRVGTGSAQGQHRVSTGSAQGQHRVGTGSAHGQHTVGTESEPVGPQ